jgi:glycosyltransferase involved in cell wall biosynthesis
MPEVCGGAAVALVEPDDANGIASWMKRLEGDSALRQETVERGLARAQAFSWDDSAVKLWTSIEQVLKP